FNIMETLEQTAGSKRTRIVIVGTAGFAENRTMPPTNNDANLELALASFQWLAEQDSLISIPPKAGRALPLALTQQAQSHPTCNDRMREIAAAIQEGASAYLNRQYTVIAIIGVIIAVVIGLAINWTTAALYVVGAILSAAAGYVGMNIAVRANVRTAEAARGGLNAALQLAFLGGAVAGFMVVGLGLIGVSGAYHLFRGPHHLGALAFGASLVSVFA